MKYLLDTNAVIALLASDPVLNARVRKHSSEDYGLPAIALHELYYGAFRSRRQNDNIARIERLQFVILDFDSEDCRIAGRVRAELAAKRTPIGPYDALIAAQAIARSLAVVTRNVKQFDRVEGLRVEDW